MRLAMPSPLLQPLLQHAGSCKGEERGTRNPVDAKVQWDYTAERDEVQQNPHAPGESHAVPELIPVGREGYVRATQTTSYGVWAWASETVSRVLSAPVSQVRSASRRM